MAARSKYPTPSEQLRKLAASALQRGLSFEEWWAEARRPGRPAVLVSHSNPPIGAVLWPTDTSERKAWLAAMDGAKDGWRRAYQGLPPTNSERALYRLWPLLDKYLSRADRQSEILSR